MRGIYPIMASGFPSQMASNAENIPKPWHHHDIQVTYVVMLHFHRDLWLQIFHVNWRSPVHCNTSFTSKDPSVQAWNRKVGEYGYPGQSWVTVYWWFFNSNPNIRDFFVLSLSDNDEIKAKFCIPWQHSCRAICENVLDVTIQMRAKENVI